MTFGIKDKMAATIDDTLKLVCDKFNEIKQFKKYPFKLSQLAKN